VPPPCKPDALRGRVFRRTDVLSRGLLTEDALRSSAWRRLFRGSYADAELPDTYGVRIRGAALLLPPSAAFSGRSAAYLHGATELVDAHSPIDGTVPSPGRQGPVTGLRIHQVPLASRDVGVLNGRRATTGLRTALDIARRSRSPRRSLRSTSYWPAPSSARGRREAAQRDNARGTRRVQRAVLLADPRAESQPQSRLRVLLALARHGDRRQFAKDRQRRNRLVAAGWTVLHVTAADLHDPVELVERIRALLSRPRSGNQGSEWHRRALFP
jgi:hypothetical protein